MKFDLKYPDVVNPQKLFPDRLMGPHKEIEVSPDLVQSWRIYPCAVCGTRTGWRDYSQGVSSPACSEECVAVMKKNAEESCAAPTVKAS